METVVHEFVHDVTEECKDTLEEQRGMFESGDAVSSKCVLSLWCSGISPNKVRL